MIAVERAGRYDKPAKQVNPVFFREDLPQKVGATTASSAEIAVIPNFDFRIAGPPVMNLNAGGFPNSATSAVQRAESLLTTREGVRHIFRSMSIS